jgi:hypothetical protein
LVFIVVNNMPNSFKYSTDAQTLALKKGNFYIGVGDVDKGPTSTTGYYNGITPPAGGYTIYLNKASGGPSIYVANNDSQLISLTNRIAGSNYSTVNQCLSYFDGQTDKVVLNFDIGNIVTDQISLCLLPQNSICYPKGGGSWYDIAKGLTMTSYGTQTPFTTMGGALGFSFNDSGYWQCTSNSNLVDLGGDCTIVMWIYGTTGESRRTIFQKNGTIYNSYEQEIAITWESGNGFSYYSRFSPDYDYAFADATTANAWSMISIKMSTGKTSAARTGFFSKNGAPYSASYFSRSNTALVAAGDLVIGTGYAGPCYSGGIGTVLCYNKMLSDSEISQVYNATKTYYGL